MKSENRKEFTNKYLSQLNENQLEAVYAVDGPVLLLAVPGSGKTTVLVNRLGYMFFCEGIKPENVLTLTYTVAATRDMSQRFTDVFGEEYAELFEFRTINGICAKIIQRYGQQVGKKAYELVTDEKVTGKILTDILRRNLNEYPTESDIKTARTLITYCKNMLLTDAEIEELGRTEQFPLGPVYAEYNAYLKNNSLMDYDDQMIYAYRLLKAVPELLSFYRNKYRYICVDEAQDTSKVQHVIIRLLAGTNGNLFMVGDEDQSIYGFRAAYPEALLNFEKDHPAAKVLVMDQNYRSNAAIVAAADSFIQKNKDRHAKHMVATREGSAAIDYIELNTRASQYAYLLKVAETCTNRVPDRSGNIIQEAVLYRDNESVLPLVDLLERNRISYRIKNVDMAFFSHRIVLDITGFMRFAQNPYDTDLFMKLYFKCQTYLKKKQAEAMCNLSLERGIPVLEAAEYISDINGMVLGKCRSLQTHLKNMLKESPDKALYRIVTPLGYEEYLERNNIDDGKIFILKMLARNEKTINGFLDRLDFLQNHLKDNRGPYGCPFVMSTIHSAKGLEYDHVYLMDVLDGVFPGKAIISSGKSQAQERRELEEERRLFYVGITRAKEKLHVFEYKDSTSKFVRELRGESKTYSKPVGSSRRAYAVNATKNSAPRNLIIGERVVQKKYGPGVVIDVEYATNGIAQSFEVCFDSGEEREFGFPMAFNAGMKMETESD